MDDWPKVGIIVLNWNGWQDTIECLESLQHLTYPNYQITVVDNGSTDDSLSKIREEYPNVRLIKSRVNRGFTGGNNLGIEGALRDKSDYILLLNNDTIVDHRMLSNLVDELKRYPKAGVATPKIFFYDLEGRKDILWSVGTQLRLTYGKTLMQGYGERDRGQYDQGKELPWASGCTMLVKASVFREVGYFDDDFFAAFEDVDFGIRARKAGFKILYVPKSMIWHKEARATGSLDSPVYIYYQVRNRLLFMKKHGKGIYWFFFVPHFCVSLLWRSVQLLINKNSFQSIFAIPLGIWDFLKGNLGPGSIKRFTLDKRQKH